MRDNSREILKEYGLKYSKNREQILEILQENTAPLSVEQIYELCRKKSSSMSLSTAYRVLKVFVSQGMAIRTNLDVEDKSLYELERHEHKHHLLCLGCNEIVPISSCPLSQYEKKLEEEMGYTITSHKLEVYGYCPSCQKI